MLPQVTQEMAAGRAARGVPMKYYEILRNPVNRDPRAYVIPSDQPDFLTATKFVNTLIKNGITIQRDGVISGRWQDVILPVHM